MADDSTTINSTTIIWATFDTGEAAGLAVEHLVQLHGISRPDIFIHSATTENTAGSAPSGSDTELRPFRPHDQSRTSLSV